MMKVELFPFQKRACNDLRLQIAIASNEYQRTHAPQVISFTAPTGAGKTIIMSALIENIYYGDDSFPDQQDAIFVWLSDSPQLNEQSKQKIDLKADKISLSQCITIQEDSFDQEYLEDGHIYFLNTQKLGKSSNLTKHGDSRTYTIWETLANTVRDKSDHLYFIIDEAHRGAQGKEAGRATTIMQKFIKGSPEDKIPPMPVVIGMSATMDRFNKLVEGTTSTIRKCIVSTDEVRASGLLKDRIVITYPEEKAKEKEMAVLQAAADDWKEKWDHWAQYCQEQHYAYVYPIFVIQVQSATGDRISDTDLDECLLKIEEQTGFHFVEGEVVHTFGQTTSDIKVNGLNVRYVEPSRITDDRKIKVVLFKENLSTGWDCPRAETMMSFRRAVDSTYIAQLLGRMVRTPLQMHIQVDDTLNDVHLYLPYFDKATVKQVVDSLQSDECGDIPTEVRGEGLDHPTYQTLTIHPKHYTEVSSTMQFGLNESNQIVQNQLNDHVEPEDDLGGLFANDDYDTQEVEDIFKDPTLKSLNNTQAAKPIRDKQNMETKAQSVQPVYSASLFDRDEVVKFINDAGLLSYDVRSIRINNYLTSLFQMAHLLSQSGLYPQAVRDVRSEIVQMIRTYIERIKDAGLYDELVNQVKLFKLETETFDIFGQSIDYSSSSNLFETTNADIDRQLRHAEAKLGNDGIDKAYGEQYIDWDNPSAYKIDVILYAADTDCILSLQAYAEEKFHELNDAYRCKIALVTSDRIRKQYDNIVSAGDAVSKHNFRLPETIKVPHDNGGKAYCDHLFVDEDTGTAILKLNTWESAVLEEERSRDDFVCWIRNPSRGSWALCIPYEIGDVYKPTYPDLIIVRRNEETGYIVDILEPHQPTLEDNFGKAQGFAEYARQNPGIGRIQLIRMSKDAAGQNRFKRLDMSMSAVRDKVLKATNQDELNHLFETDGFFTGEK